MPIVVFVVETLIECTGAYETLELVVEILDVLEEEKEVLDGPIEVELLEVELLEVELLEEELLEEELLEEDLLEEDLLNVEEAEDVEEVVDEDEDDDNDDEVIE